MNVLHFIVAAQVLSAQPVCFDSETEAAIALANAPEIGNFKEFSGAIVAKNDRFCATELQKSNGRDSFSFSVSLAKGERLSAIFHTHTHKAKCSLHSENDVVTSEALGVNSYMLCTRENELRVFGPKNGNTLKEKRNSFLSKGARWAKGILIPYTK